VKINPKLHGALRRGLVIPAHPLALTAERRIDERRQRALTRYYCAAGVGGLAVGVHTTQFAIHDPGIGLYEPVLSLAAEEMDRGDAASPAPLFRVAGLVGQTDQAVCEAGTARALGYHAGLLSLGSLVDADEDALVRHCREVAAVLPVFGFYLHSSIGGRVLSYAFWRRFVEIENVVAIKVAAFNRYQTLDVVRAVAESGRDDVALYTGNDDNIVLDLITPYRFQVDGTEVERRFVGGLLGHWAFWTRRAVELHRQCRELIDSGGVASSDLLATAIAVTDVNASVFDVAHNFAGCLPGVHEVLRRQGLMEGTYCLDPTETLSPGQATEIDRVQRTYQHLTDEEFVAEHRDEWLAG
jgi:dihydrodipicolinate synthase/N-acetylneuraminate lyase